MAAVGPASFYEATSFCDYPPLYTYILGLNACITDLLQAGTELTRVIYRFVPSLCDLAGCWMIYRLMIRQKLFRPDTCLFFLGLALFNPATILNYRKRKNSEGKETGTDFIDGPEIVLSSAEVSNPVKVRYMGKPLTSGTLYNEASLPLGPFESTSECDPF